MNLYVQNNFNGIDKFIEKANKFLEDENAEIIIDLVGSASRPQTFEYNDALGTRRTDSAQKYIRSKITYNNRLKFKSQSRGERDGVTAKTFTPIGLNGNSFEVSTCSGFTQDKIYSQQAMACRRTLISNIKATISTKPKKKEPTETITNSDVIIKRQKKEKNFTEITNKLYRNVSKKVLQKLLSECDYFATIEETDPFIYNSLKEKLKYFSPAFHSTTPEGLNGRLTFLQQCVRPGDTIPTIREGGVREFKDARNTAFGVPPVLVLRVGDFFHTKIIPDNLAISYDPLHWDINPEGIGFQPMIAKVTLSFKFVGASGLSNAVDKLQNALSFNYYANTEVYDARADKTDNSLDDMDEKILDFIREKEKGKTENFDDIKVVNAYKTIGEINTTATTLNYITLATELVEASTAYVNTINSVIQENSKAYNIELVSLILKSLNNVNGVYNPTTGGEFKLLGVPTDYQKTIDDYVKIIKDNIKTNSDGFIEQINEEFKNLDFIVIDGIEQYSYTHPLFIQNLDRLVKSRLNSGKPIFLMVLGSTSNISTGSGWNSLIRNCLTIRLPHIR